MHAIRATLVVALAALMVDSIIELSFITSMVSWLHTRGGGSFEVDDQDSSFSLHSKPLYLSVNQGHTSNGAAGTAFVINGIGGFLALFIRCRSAQSSSAGLRKFNTFFNCFWLIMTILSTLLTLSALIYTFLVTKMTSGQTIDIALASTLNNQPYPNYVAYPDDVWTPETWFEAVLKLPLVSSRDISDIQAHLDVMKGWKWNLIPMFVIGLFTCVVAFIDAVHCRRCSVEQKNSQDEKILESCQDEKMMEK